MTFKLLHTNGNIVAKMLHISKIFYRLSDFYSSASFIEVSCVLNATSTSVPTFDW